MDQLAAEMERLRAAASVRAAVSAIAPEIAPPHIDLPELYPLQQRIKSEAKRFNVLDIGRRAGKTFLGIHLALETALAGDPVGWFSPRYKYLLEAWADLCRPLRDVAARINATERRIELPNGGLLEIWTLEDPDAGRSRKYKRVIVDEAAAAPHLKTAWEEGIRPTLTDFAGDAWFLSTPKGLNYFYELYKRGADPLQPDWISWQMASSVNPYLPPGEIEAARLELPEQVYQQEYLAEFLSSEGAVFRNVDACLTSLPTEPMHHRGHLTVAGIDWGRSHDFTAISVYCAKCGCEVFLDRFNQIGWDFQRGRVLAALERWGVSYARVETNSIGSPNLEALRAAAPESIVLMGFETTQKSKPKLIQRLALAIEQGVARWLPDPIAKHELIAYEATITENGYTKYSAPEGGFDDTVIARALAWKTAEAEIPVPLTKEEKLQEELDRDFSELAYLHKLKKGEREHYTEQEQMDFYALEVQRERHKKFKQSDGRSWSANVIDPDDDPFGFYR